MGSEVARGEWRRGREVVPWHLPISRGASPYRDPSPTEFVIHVSTWSLTYLWSPCSRSRQITQQISTQSPSQQGYSMPTKPNSCALCENYQVVAFGKVFWSMQSVWRIFIFSPLLQWHVQILPKSLYIAPFPLAPVLPGWIPKGHTDLMTIMEAEKEFHINPFISHLDYELYAWILDYLDITASWKINPSNGVLWLGRAYLWLWIGTEYIRIGWAIGKIQEKWWNWACIGKNRWKWI